MTEPTKPTVHVTDLGEALKRSVDGEHVGPAQLQVCPTCLNQPVFCRDIFHDKDEPTKPPTISREVDILRNHRCAAKDLTECSAAKGVLDALASARNRAEDGEQELARLQRLAVSDVDARRTLEAGIAILEEANDGYQGRCEEYREETLLLHSQCTKYENEIADLKSKLAEAERKLEQWKNDDTIRRLGYSDD